MLQEWWDEVGLGELDLSPRIATDFHGYGQAKVVKKQVPPLRSLSLAPVGMTESLRG